MSGRRTVWTPFSPDEDFTMAGDTEVRNSVSVTFEQRDRGLGVSVCSARVSLLGDELA